MSAELHLGRYSLTDASEQRAPGSTGRCRTLDMTWLLSLGARRRSVIEQNKLMDELKSQGFTNGLARTLIHNREAVAVRIWLVDNSGSMNNTDGHLVVQATDKIRNVPCTRWEEVTGALLWHAEFNANMKAPMVIRLANDPGVNAGPQQLGVSASENVNVDSELQRLRRLLKCHPGGSTPLTVHLQDILTSLRQVDTSLFHGKMISIVIVTDRLPRDAEGSEGQFLETLKAFQDYPVWIVIRLSTDERRVVEFYGNMDQGIAILRQMRGEANHARRENIRLDVLDDYVSEAAEVAKHNPWLNYGLPLHIIRESGSMIAAFDAINERPLDFAELTDFVALLFDQHATLEDHGGLQTLDEAPLPDAQTDYRDFRKNVHQLSLRSGDIWNPVKKKMLPWINLKELDRIYASGQPVTNATVASEASCSCQIS